MKTLLIWLVILTLPLTAIWYGAESLLGNAARNALAGQPGLSADIAPMRQPGRLGLRMADLRLADAGGTASLPALDAYIRLTSPTTLTVDLPQAITLAPTGTPPTEIALEDGRAELTIAPTRGLAISHAGFAARDLSLNGAPLFDAARAEARLTHMGSAAPPGSAAAYRIDLSGAGILPDDLPAPLDISGSVQIWLDGLPDRHVLDASAPPPRLTGLQTQALTISLDGMRARLAGRISADADGFASGQMAIYTGDGPAFVDAAMMAGLITPDLATPLQSLIERIAGTPEEGADAAPLPGMEDLTDDPVTLPPARPGEIRLPIFLSEGIARLGPIPLGPAPRLSGF
ncbi:MAG: DUF2125 domain-containing protein [Paracoccus sp. (in: a-proteobacteria)]|nr:DUF2125 domain-containing protein [Paracoccus sp. (in: a-proteobacteria)]